MTIRDNAGATRPTDMERAIREAVRFLLESAQDHDTVNEVFLPLCCGEDEYPHVSLTEGTLKIMDSESDTELARHSFKITVEFTSVGQWECPTCGHFVTPDEVVFDDNFVVDGVRNSSKFGEIVSKIGADWFRLPGPHEGENLKHISVNDLERFLHDETDLLK
jgi:hypothetical protein